MGSCLAAVGVTLQALLRNPLADPYVLGVSSGAALGVSLAMLFGIGTTFLAIAGASALWICRRTAGAGRDLSVGASLRGRLPIHSLLLAGVILNAILSALIMFITSIMEPNRSVGIDGVADGVAHRAGLSGACGVCRSIWLVLGLLLHKAQC